MKRKTSEQKAQQLSHIVGKSILKGTSSSSLARILRLIEKTDDETFTIFRHLPVHSFRIYTGFGGGGWWAGVEGANLLHTTTGLIPYEAMTSYTSDKHALLERVWWPMFEYSPRSIKWKNFDILALQIHGRV